MDLEELKAENAKQEEEAAAKAKLLADEQDNDDEEEEAEPEGEQSKSEEEGKRDPEIEEESGEDSWLKSDDQTDDDGDKKFTDGDVAAAKKKLRAKLERKQAGETEELKAEIERLKAGGNTQAKELQKPKRDDFFNADDQDEAYAEALMDWKIGKAQADASARTAQQQRQQTQTQQASRTEKAVNDHYARAEKLAKDSGISDELYHDADLRVRQAINTVFDGAGDTITDALIANVGEGSERVFYNIGINKARMKELTDLLQDDPTGLRAATYLGKRSAELASPSKRKTAAPRPAAHANGDASGSSSEKAQMKKYRAAFKSGDVQAAFDIKYAAKKSGAAVKDW